MMPTSAIKSGSNAQIPEVLAIICRRASHEVRNALNGVAVNVEVVRSRLAKPASDLKDLHAFAERAAKESDGAAALVAGLADLTSLLARTVTGEGKPVMRKSAGSTSIELPVYTSDNGVLSTDLKALAARMGVSISLDGRTVIFTVRD